MWPNDREREREREREMWTQELFLSTSKHFKIRLFFQFNKKYKYFKLVWKKHYRIQILCQKILLPFGELYFLLTFQKLYYMFHKKMIIFCTNNWYNGIQTEICLFYFLQLKWIKHEFLPETISVCLQMRLLLDVRVWDVTNIRVTLLALILVFNVG